MGFYMHDRNEILKQLEKTKSKIKELEEMAQIGTWEFDLRTNKMSWSDQMFLIFRRNLEQGVPSLREFLDYIHASDRLTWDLAFNKASYSSYSYDMEFRLADLNEGPRWLRKTVIGVHDNNNLIGLRGFCQDITELKELQQHLSNTEELIQLMA